MTLDLPIYMDNASTTRTDPRVLEAMLPFFLDTYGNRPAGITPSAGPPKTGSTAPAVRSPI